MQSFRLGILGAGKIACSMAETVKKLNAAGNHEVILTAVGSRDLSKAQSFIKDHNLASCKAYASYLELVSAPDVDGIYVATPHNFHKEHALLAIKHSKHVLVEKSFTANLKEAQEVIKVALEHKVTVTEAIWTRYQPMRSLVQNLLSSGIIGTPTYISANLGYNISFKDRIVKPELAGGALLDLGVYVLNFALMFFGHPDNVEASAVKNALGVDMQESISLSWNDGRMASLQATALAQSDRHGVIYGSKGFIEVDNVNNPERCRVYDCNYNLMKTVERPQQLTGFEYELLEWSHCALEHKNQCPSMSHDETLYIMGLMDSIRAQLGIKFPFEK